MRAEKTGAVCIFGAGMLWGTVGLFIRRLSACGASPELISFLRVLLAGGIMAVYGLIRGGISSFRVRKKTLIACAMLGLVCHGVYNVLRSIAVLYAGVGVSTVLQNIAPVITLLCSAQLFGERITVEKYLAVALCMLGCMLAATNGDLSAASVSMLGVLCSLGAGACSGMTAIFSRLAGEDADPTAISIYSYLFAALFLGLWLRPWNGLPSVSGEILAWSFLYALIPTALAFLLYYRGVQSIRETGKVPVLASSETVGAMLLGSLTCRETLGGGQLLGVVLVLAAVVMMNIKFRRRIPV